MSIQSVVNGLLVTLGVFDGCTVVWKSESLKKTNIEGSNKRTRHIRIRQIPNSGILPTFPKG